MSKFSYYALIMFALIGCKGQVERVYYPNGVLKKELFLNRDGHVNGEVREYYENGKISGTFNYMDGIKSGEVRLYREDGSLEQRHFYENGKLSGKIEFFYPSGELHQIQFFDSDERLLDVWTLSKDGSRSFDIDTLIPIIITESETVDFGNVFECRIKLGNSQSNWIDVVLSERNDPGFLDKPMLPKLDSATAFLQIKTQKEGDNIVEGYILEINRHYPDSVLPIFFEKKFYVRKQLPNPQAGISELKGNLSYLR